MDRRLIEVDGYMSRIHRWLTQGPFAIVSTGPNPDFPDKPWQKQMEQMSELKERVLRDGYGFQPATGIYERLSEPSIFIPMCALSDALLYGDLFKDDEHGPQRTILHGEHGIYSIYRVSDGSIDSGGDVLTDFEIMSEPEMQHLTQKNTDAGTTQAQREPARHRTSGFAVQTWCENRKQRRSSGTVSGMYLVGSATGWRHYMAHFSGIKHVTAVHGGTVFFEDERVHRAEANALLYCIPLDTETVLSNMRARLQQK